MSSDGGLIVLREAALRLGLADVIAKLLPDTRDPARVVHSYADMVTARMMAIAAGYEDCDDLVCLRTDPALKLACGRAPESGADLMSQPTLSRLENLAQRRTLMEIGLGFIDLFCRSWTRVPDRVVLDIVILKACSPPARHGRSRTRPTGAGAVQHACRGPLFSAHADL